MIMRFGCIELFCVLLAVFSLAVPSNASAIECYECHGTKNPPDYRPVDASSRDPRSGGFQGSHRKHLPEGATPYTCSICHPGSESYGPNHQDGIVTVSMDAYYPAKYRNGSTATRQGGAVLGSCTNVYCHNDGTYPYTGIRVMPKTPVWGNGGQSCDACHGNPPSYASGSPKVNSHQKHLFGCNRCHYATTTTGTSITGSYSHRNDSYEVYGPPSEPFSYGGVRQCYNTYCHGNGTNVATGQASASSTSPSWGTSASLACTSCHAYPPAYAKGVPKANAHLLHNSYNYRCSQCHYASTRDGASLAAGNTSHANRAYDVSGPPDKPVTYSYNATGGSCTNYCHSSVQGKTNPIDPPVYATPKWSDSYIRSCRNCHKAGYHAFDSFLMDTGSHFKHLQFDSTSHTCRMCHYTAKYGSAGSCYECHNPNTTFIGSNPHYDTSPRGPEHANGVVNVAFHPNFPTTGATGSYTGDTVPGTAYGVCANLYCHSQGTKNTPPYATANIPTVTWGSGPLPADCSGCHGGDINSSIPMATQSHVRHIGLDCAKCHAGTAYSSRSAIPNQPLPSYLMYSRGSYHTNGNVEVWFLNTTTAINGTYAGQNVTINRAPGASPGRCVNVYCHTAGTAVVAKTSSYGNISTPIWGTSGRLGCGSCHGNPPAYPDGYPKGNGHLKHNADCKNCHYGVTTNNTTIADKTKHGQYRYDVSYPPGISFNYTYASNGSICSNVTCHSNGGAARDWGTSCIHCHGNPPNPGGHQKSHLAYGCHYCHYTVTTNGNWITDPLLHNNGKKTIAPGAGASFTNLSTMTGYCGNVSCHSDGTAVATGQPHNNAYGSVRWSATVLQCYDCHREQSYWERYDYPNGSPKANSHQKHCATNRISCRTCHYSVVDGGGNLSTLHKNGQYDLKPLTGSVGFTYTYATNADHSRGGTCTNINCHGDGTAVTTNAPVTASATWGGASLACNSCHGYPPAYPNYSPKVNGHQGKHLAYSCDKCHYGFPSGHTDGFYNVAGGTYIKMTYTKMYYSTCSNVSCHGDGTSTTTWIAPVNGPLQWGATQSFTCSSCHAMPPSYTDRQPKANAHPSHTAYGCQVCHFNITADGSTIADRSRHADGFYNLSTNGSASFRYTFGLKGSSCGNISCHADAAKNRNWTYQPLGLNSVYPGTDYTNVDVSTTIQLNFAEPMDMNSVNSTSFYLKQGNTTLPGSYRYQANGYNSFAVSFVPDQPLQYFTTYTATFTNDIKAATGVNITSGRTWSFTTGHSPQYGAVLSQSFPSPFDLSPFTVTNGAWITDYYVSKTYMNGVWATAAETSAVESVLQTPQLNLSSYRTLILQFSYNLKYTAPNAAYVDVSTNGSSGPWTTVWSRSDSQAAGSTSGNYAETIDLSALLRYQPNVMLRFRFNVAQVPQYSQGAFSVDDIYVYADPN